MLSLSANNQQRMLMLRQGFQQTAFGMYETNFENDKAPCFKNFSNEFLIALAFKVHEWTLGKSYNGSSQVALTIVPRISLAFNFSVNICKVFLTTRPRF